MGTPSPQLQLFGRDVLVAASYGRAQQPYTKDEILAYLALCQTEVDTRINKLDFAAPSGLDWLPLNKLELMLYSLRHLQHHTGELGERLGQQRIEVDWVGQHPQEMS